MKPLLRLREFFRHLYVMLFGSFEIRKVIKDSGLLLCDPLGHPLLHIRDCKCELMLAYRKDGLVMTLAVYGAKFYPHAYRYITYDANNPIVREYQGDIRKIGQVHVYDNKMTVLRFHGLMSETHEMKGVIAGAPVVTVSDEYKDDFIASEDHLIDETDRLIETKDPIGAVRFVPLMTYSGKGYIHA